MKEKIMDFIFNKSQIFDRLRSMVHLNYKNEKKIISKNFKKDKITLDFGCGIGQFSVIFNSNKYYGTDIDKKYINFCRKNHKGNFQVIKNSPPYNFKDKYFDQILVSAVIHHIDKKTLQKISKELKRILKNKGELMIIDHYTIKNQKNLFCKFLINIDRGNHFRNSNKVKEIFSKEFKIKKIENFKNGPYRDYIIILTKK